MKKKDDVATIQMRKITPEVAAEIKAKMKELDDRWHNRIPPTPRLAECIICKTHTVTETFEKKFHGEMRYGGTNNGYWESSGLSCKTCGIQYAKLPYSPE